MLEHGERIVGLEIDGRLVTYFSARLFRGQAMLPGGLPGQTSWRVELVDAALPVGFAGTVATGTVAIRVDSGLGWEAGTAVVDGSYAGRGSLQLDGTGDLVLE